MIHYYFNYYKRFVKSLISVNNKACSPCNIYPSIGLINTSVCTSNLGDLIIYEAVYKQLREIFSEAFFTNYPSHIHRDYDAKLAMSKEDLLLVGGTNLLSSDMRAHYEWKIDPMDQFFIKNKVVLMGVGWWQYQDKPDRYTKNLLKSVLATGFIHSVRDNYTKAKLNSIGMDNVVNTACPTLWDLKPGRISHINRNKSNNVVTTLTAYNMDEELDRRMLNILLECYENVYLWIQGIRDFDYLNIIFPGDKRIKLIPPSIEAYNEILNTNDIEYLGTRLHAGIRAIQLGKRALIVAVDNRAIEMGKDVNLNVIDRKDIEKSYDFIRNEYITDIRLPQKDIDNWKSQFLHFKSAGFDRRSAYTK